MHPYAYDWQYGTWGRARPAPNSLPALLTVETARLAGQSASAAFARPGLLPVIGNTGQVVVKTAASWIPWQQEESTTVPVQFWETLSAPANRYIYLGRHAAIRGASAYVAELVKEEQHLKGLSDQIASGKMEAAAQRLKTQLKWPLLAYERAGRESSAQEAALISEAKRELDKAVELLFNAKRELPTDEALADAELQRAVQGLALCGGPDVAKALRNFGSLGQYTTLMDLAPSLDQEKFVSLTGIPGEPNITASFVPPSREKPWAKTYCYTKLVGDKSAIKGYDVTRFTNNTLITERVQDQEGMDRFCRVPDFLLANAQAFDEEAAAVASRQEEEAADRTAYETAINVFNAAAVERRVKEKVAVQAAELMVRLPKQDWTFFNVERHVQTFYTLYVDPRMPVTGNAMVLKNVFGVLFGSTVSNPELKSQTRLQQVLGAFVASHNTYEGYHAYYSAREFFIVADIVRLLVHRGFVQVAPSAGLSIRPLVTALDRLFDWESEHWFHQFCKIDTFNQVSRTVGSHAFIGRGLINSTLHIMLLNALAEAFEIDEQHMIAEEYREELNARRDSDVVSYWPRKKRMLEFFALRALGMAAVMANAVPLLRLALSDQLFLGVVRHLTGFSLHEWATWVAAELAKLEPVVGPLATRLSWIPGLMGLSNALSLGLLAIAYLSLGIVMEAYDRGIQGVLNFWREPHKSRKTSSLPGAWEFFLSVLFGAWILRRFPLLQSGWTAVKKAVQIGFAKTVDEKGQPVREAEKLLSMVDEGMLHDTRIRRRLAGIKRLIEETDMYNVDFQPGVTTISKADLHRKGKPSTYRPSTLPPASAQQPTARPALLGNVFEQDQETGPVATIFLPPENTSREDEETLSVMLSSLDAEAGRLGWFTEAAPSSVTVAASTGADAVAYPFILSLK